MMPRFEELQLWEHFGDSILGSILHDLTHGATPRRTHILKLFVHVFIRHGFPMRVPELLSFLHFSIRYILCDCPTDLVAWKTNKGCLLPSL